MLEAIFIFSEEYNLLFERIFSLNQAYEEKAIFIGDLLDHARELIPYALDSHQLYELK